MDTEKQTIKLIAEQLNIKKEEDIKPGSRLVDDLKADSLDMVELVMSLEENFDLQIPDGDAEKLQTVKNVVEYIKKHRDSS